MRRVSLAALSICVAPLAMAQQAGTDLVVRSGEHGAFTRLVLPLPSGATWTAEGNQDASVLRLSISGAQAQFDLSQAFQRIDRDRISDLTSPSPGQIDISLGCDCGAETFVVDGNLLVVDIKPGVALPGGLEMAQANQPTGEDTAAPAIAPTQTVRLAPSPLLDDLSRVRIGTRPGIGPMAAADPLLPRLPVRSPVVQPHQTAEEQASGDKNPSDLGSQIAEDLAAAATAGLLDPAIRSVDEPLQILVPKPAPHSEVAGSTPSTADLARQLAAGLTNADHSNMRDGRVSLGGENCVPDRKIDLAAWGGEDEEVSALMAERRSSLFGEFDKVNAHALEEYAKTLLHFGFGAEARVTLDMDPDHADRTLVSLSFLVDGENDPTGVFRDQLDCPGPAAFWSVLATPDLSSSDNVDHNAVLQTLEALPPHLKGHLGVRLAQRMEAAGYMDSARDIYRRIERAGGVETSEIALGRAQIDMEKGNYDAAEARLKPLSEQGGPQTPEAIMARVDIAEAKGERLPTRIVDLAAAYTAEMRDAEGGVDMWQSHIRALILNGAFEQAFDAMDAAEGVPEDRVATTRQQAMAALVDKAEDLTFLKLAIGPQGGAVDDTLDDPTILNIADRLVGLGMARPALNYLDHLADPDSARQAQLIRAAALLDQGNPEEAEIQLVGLVGDDVSQLRAEARRQMGDYTFARELYDQLGAQEQATTSAWLSGNWAEVASQTEGGILAEAAMLLQSDQPEVATGIPTLAEAEALSAQSASSLDTIRSLLEATQIEGQ